MPFPMLNDAQRNGTFVILTVCTGNICRSPLAEGLLRMQLADLPVEVHSAGMSAMVGMPMSLENRRIAEQLGVPDADEHRARQLTADHVRTADLVLTLARSHRRSVVELLPRASRHTFTIREFARLADTVIEPPLARFEGDSAEARMRAAVETVAQSRGSLAPSVDPLDDDVIDPYRQSEAVYALSAAQLVPAVSATVRLLRHAAEKPGILREGRGVTGPTNTDTDTDTDTDTEE